MIEKDKKGPGGGAGRGYGKIILGGGLGVRLGQPYADKIAKAMLPHLFNDHRPPPVLVAALGDLSGAIGASMLSPSAPARAA